MQAPEQVAWSVAAGASRASAFSADPVGGIAELADLVDNRGIDCAIEIVAPECFVDSDFRQLVAAAAAALFAALRVSGDNYLLRLGTTVAMYVTLATAWNIIGGFAGYPSFATAAFFGLGVYTSGITLSNGILLAAGWAGAGVMAALFAIVLGLCILHLRGHYFAIGNLVIPDVLREVTNTWVSVTGGGIGLNLPLIGGSADCRAESGSAQGCSFRYRRDRWLD